LYNWVIVGRNRSAALPAQQASKPAPRRVYRGHQKVISYNEIVGQYLGENTMFLQPSPRLFELDEVHRNQIAKIELSRHVLVKKAAAWRIQRVADETLDARPVISIASKISIALYGFLIP
jgi:hypothetical protein